MKDQTAALSNVFWSLCHGVDQVRIDGLQLVQVQALIKAFRPENLDAWFVWYEGSNDWIPVRERLPLILGPAHPGVPVPPALEATKTFVPSETITKKLPPDTRMMPRFQMNMEVVIEFKGKLIKSRTLDISLGGMRIEADLPFPANSIVMVTLKHKGTELGMRCKVVHTEENSHRNRLLIENCLRMELLRDWILGSESSKKTSAG